MGLWLWLVVKLAAFVALSFAIKALDVWHPLIEFPLTCDHPALPGNRTGIKVLVAGYAKTGTRTICHALNNIGIRTYHSEDFHLMPWWDFVAGFRARHPEEGRRPVSGEIGLRTTVPGPEREALAKAVSRCRMESVALDGLEALTLPLYETSPGAKVLMLSWRTYEEWTKSGRWFLPKLGAMVWFNLLTGSSLSALPWAALVRLLDPLVGRPVEQLLRTGGPAITEVSGPLVFLHHQALNHRRQYEAWRHPSVGFYPATAEQYYAGMDSIREAVPRDRLMEWDHRKNTYEDLCLFAGVSPCPRRGKMPRSINTWIFERDFPVASNAVLILRFFLHWVNWKLFGALLSGLRRVALFCCCPGRTAGRRPKKD